jgi:GTP-binding protein of the ras superfamily involved in termination of M-phase
MDVEMAEHDDSMNNTTITQSTLHQQQPLYQQPVYQHPVHQQPLPPQQQPQYQPQHPDPNNGNSAAGAVQDPMHYHNGASNNGGATAHGFPRPTTAHSDTPFSRSAGYQPYSDQDSTPPYRRGSTAQQQQQQVPQKMPSRPPSGMSGSVQYGQPQQEQSPGKNPSVVIKVGMVGDAQIGKTSLMVKYVVSRSILGFAGVDFRRKEAGTRTTYRRLVCPTTLDSSD